MKIALFSESPADEAALRVLVDALRGEATAVVSMHTSIRTHGWPSVRDLLPNAIAYLYFNTDADGLVVLVDSDDSSIHKPEHDELAAGDPDCRYCVLLNLAHRELARLQDKIIDRKLRVAIGIASPAIEAWCQCGIDVHATELSWGRGLGSGRRSHERAKLKIAVYRTDRPSLVLETAKMVEAAHRLAGNLEPLERHFPVGFGLMAAEVRNW